MTAIFTGLGAGFERGSGSVIGSGGLLGSSILGRGGEQMFLNATTGNFMVSQRDEFLVGLGLDVGVSRTYNSLGDFSDENGDNWRQGTDRRVYDLTGTVNTAGSTVKRVSGDGSEITYTWQNIGGTNAYWATDGAGAYDKLTYNGTTTNWTWTDGDSRVTETYDAYSSQWRITAQTDADGNALTFSYTDDKLYRVTTKDGSYVQYNWAGSNITEVVTGYTDLATSTAKTLTRTRYGYDVQNRLTSVTVDLSPDDNSVSDANTYVTTYTYDGTSKRIASISQSDGSHLALTYDGSHRVATLVQTSATGVTRTSSLAYGTGYTTVTDPLGNVARLDYNADGSLSKITMPPAASGGSAQIVQFAYDAGGDGDLTSIIDALGNATAFIHDANGNVTSATDREGNVTTRIYGAKNELLTETTTSSDADSAAAAHTVRFAYDSENHLRYRISAEGSVTEYRYTGTGQLQYTIRYPEHPYDLSGLTSTQAPTDSELDAWRDGLADRSSTEIVQNLYDARGNLTQITAYSISTPTGGLGTAEGWSRSFFTYDQAGRLLSRNASAQNAETFVYDGLGRMVSAVDINGGTTSYVFNDAQSKTIVTLASGLIQTSTYNLAGELIDFTESTAAGGLTAAVGTATYGYDQLGRLRWQLDATGRKSYVLYDNAGRKVADVSSTGEAVEYRYDASNRLVATIRRQSLVSSAGLASLANENVAVDWNTISPSANDYDLWQWHVYDKEGRLLQTIDSDGSTVVRSYDGAGRLVRSTSYYNKIAAGALTGFETTLPTAVTWPTSDAARDHVSRTFYDKDGRLLGVLNGEGFVSQILYDNAGRKIEEIAFLNATTADKANGTFGQLVAGVTAHADDRRMRYVYDGQGQLRFFIDAKLQVTETIFDTAGQATSVRFYATALSPSTTDFTFDNVKALVSAAGFASANDRSSWSVYDGAGRLAYAINAANGVTAYSYNATGQVTKAVEFVTLRATSTLPSLASMDSWAATNLANTANRITRHFYDKSGVLRYSVDGEGFVSRQDVDEEGRITSLTRWANAVSVDDSSTTDSVHTAITASGGTMAVITKAYDALGRLATQTDAEGTVQARFYNANGSLALEISAWGTPDEASTVYFYHLGTDRVSERHDAWQTADVAITRFTYDGLGNTLTITDPNNKVTTQTFDRLGQLLTRTDALSGVTSFQYDAFGNVVKVTDVRGHSTYSYYDNLDRLTVTRDAEDYVTETSYTVFGQITSVTRRYNKATNGAAVGVLPTVTAHAKDAATSFEYDKVGRVTKTTDAEGFYEQYTLNAFGDRITVRNKLAANTTNSFDRRGLLIAETLPMQSVRSDGTIQATTVTNKFEYDSRGNRTTMIEAYGLTEQRTTNYAYDKLNRLITKSGDALSVLSQSNHLTTSTVTPTESYVYDRRGNLIQVTDALGGRTVSYYDDLDRKIGEVGSLGTLRSWTYDAAGNRLTERVYGDAVTVPTLPSAAPPAPINASNYRETVFTYDDLGRLATSSVANVLVGVWNGSTGVSPAAQTITTTLTYDAAGNVILTTDANGGLVHAWFDKLGRKTAQLDAEGYLTSWTYDGEGNALSERRHATKWTGAVTTSAPPAVSNHADDRITNFTYDKTGHRLTETRTGVVAWSVNTTNGAVTQTGTNAVITYTYNGLGQVLTKAEATGNTVTYTYDSTGRLTKESRAAYADQTGATVTPTVTYSYDGINNLSRTQQGGAVLNGTTDRITLYTYGAGGRLSSLTDAAGGIHNYAYDTAGNLLRDSYTRVKSNGTSVNEGILYTRDIQGRVTAQAIATNTGSAWVRGDSQNTEFNAFGDISRRGLNGLWQESFTYDNAGRLIKNNSGDGVWRFFVYDANGNRTLTLESEGTDLSGLTLTQALALARPGGVAAGSAFVDGINLGITIYDKRNMATSSRLPQRELATGGTRVSVNTSQTYNAFGEVLSQTDARGYTTDFLYNTMGRLIEKKSPQVNWTNDSGTVASARPIETYYYDLGGRLVGSRDANGNLTSRTLLAGTGHGAVEAMVTAEYHADGGIAKTFYDVFGDAKILRNELNADETRTYDKMGRLITQVHRGALLTDNYTYDLLGQRITHWNSFLGSSNKETTDYDLQGRVISVRAFGGDTTTTTYVWDATIANSGMSAVAWGGWTQTDTYANSKTMVVKTGMFGHQMTKVDLGSHSFTYAYDRAGRLTTRTTTGETQTTTWLNSGLAAKIEFGGSDYSTFTYDANGNRLTEYTVRGSVVVQNATSTYDALGRLVTWSEAGGTQTPYATKSIEYDKNGNIRRDNGTYRTFNDDGVISTTNSTQNLLFKYDAMNRVTLSDSTTLSAGAGTGNSTLNTYDVAGQRIKVERNIIRTQRVVDPNYDVETHGTPIWWIYISYTVPQREDFTYRPDGALSTVRSATGTGQDTDGDGIFDSGTTPPSPGELKGSFTYDAMGRLTRQIDYVDNGVTSGYDRQVTYNAKGQITFEEINRKQWDGDSWDLFTDEITNQYGTGTNYALGAITQSDTEAFRFGNDSDAPDPRTVYTYAWYDGAVVSSQAFTTNTNDSTPQTYTSTFTNSPSGILTQAIIADHRPRRVTYTTDMAGEVIIRDEDKKVLSSYTANGPKEFWHRFNGREMNYTSNNGAVGVSLTQTDYVTSIAKRTAQPSTTTTGMFAGGASTTGTAYADVDASYDHVTSYGQGSAAGRHSVRAGETLQSIAQAVWGDSSYWYKLAEANGLSADSFLVEGQALTLPAGVVRSKNNASTFKPYDAAETMGDTAPMRIKPPKPKKGGLLGKILLAVIQIAVTVLLTAVGVPAPVAAMIGNVASQGVGMATGLQSGFSWQGVAMSGITAGVTGGIDASGIFAGITNSTLNAGVTAATSSAISQGIGVATGLQKKFDWVGVAAAGVGAMAGNVAMNAAGKQLGLTLTKTNGAYDSPLHGAIGSGINSAASAVANAATRSVVQGTNFGDNIIAALPDAIAGTIGGFMQAGIAMDRAKRARMVAAAEASSPSVDPGSSMAAAGATGQTFAWMPDDPWGVGAEASANLIEFERNTNLDWGGSEVQALHDQSKIRIQAEFVSDYIETQFGNSASVSSSAYGRIVAAVGDIPQSQLTGESYVPIFQDYGLTPEFGQWLNESGYVSVSGTNAADIIGRTSIFDLEKVVLPALELHQDYNNVRPLYDAVSKHVLGINRMADRVVWDVVSAGLSLDAPTAAYRMANGEVNWGNGITLGASFAGPLGSGAKVFFKGSADLGEGVSGLYRVGAFNQLQGTARGLDAHHVGQKALMGRFIPGYDPITAPAILVPKVGHTIRGPSGIVSRSLVGLDNARSVVARDIWELRRVYTDIPNTQLQELVKLNRSSYPEAFTKGR